MQTAKGRASPKESPTKVSPRSTRQIKVNPIEINSSSSSTNAPLRIPKESSPKVIDRRSPRSLVCEKRPSKLSELESQISKLQNDLKTVKDQLIVSESSKKEAQEEAQNVKGQLADLSQKLEESRNQFSELDASKNDTIIDKQGIAQEDDIEIKTLKDNLAETSSIVESMKYELEKTKESEGQARNLVSETLLQLEAAKDTINTLRSDAFKSTEAYNSIAKELNQSRAKVSFLESFVNNLNKVNSDDHNEAKKESTFDEKKLQMELETAKLDVKQLRSALEASEIRFNEERSNSGVREAELAEELKKTSAQVDELKNSLLDKETEIQAISEENENLKTELGNSESCHLDAELAKLKNSLMDKEIEIQAISEENEILKTELVKSESCHVDAELAKLRELVDELKEHLMDKETELQNVLNENERLKLDTSKREMEKAARDAELEAARHAELEARTKLDRVSEQLETAQAGSADMEAELRRLTVQSCQWRKAAEAAASMISPGANENYVERTGSMPLGGKYSPYLDEYDDDSFKKKNGNVLKKIGVLWKRPQK